MSWKGPRAVGAALGTLFLALSLGGCGSTPDVDDRRPHIVLISIDSLRADHLGCYGYGRPTSPTLDALAQDGVLFEDVSSSSSWTLPAHAALFTGLPDSVHGADRGEHKLESWQRTLAEALQDHGYRTAGIWSGPLLDPRFGFAQGFDSYLGLDAEAPDSWESRVQRSHEVVTGPRVLDRLEDVLRHRSEASGNSSAPLFLFIHLWDVHYDYIPPPPFDGLFVEPNYDGPVDGRGLADLVLGKRPAPTGADLEHLKALYDGEIAFVDGQIAAILERLRAELDGELLTLVTADHGEEFFEHGHFGHKRTLFEESIRIPWILHAPDLLPTNLRLAEPVRIVDVAPTQLELVGADPLPDTLGRSLMPMIRGETMPSQPVISELVRGSGDLVAARVGPRKIIASPERKEIIGAFDLTTDPHEQRNRLGEDGRAPADSTRVLRQATAEIDRLKSLHRGTRSIDGLDEDLRRELESLGYVGGDSGDAPGLKSE
ncbi:MAG: sulfatase, partial [Acidobacteriota bacterium]